MIDEELVENQKLALDIPYDQVRLVTGAQRIGGAIFNINIDNTHPLGYGYKINTLYLEEGIHSLSYQSLLRLTLEGIQTSPY